VDYRASERMAEISSMHVKVGNITPNLCCCGLSSWWKEW